MQMTRFRVAHIADLHLRGRARHDEFRQVLNDFFVSSQANNVDAIVICGDVWHTKTQGLTPEAINELVWLFRSAANICPVYVLLGNHDLNLHNKTRMDTLSPVINALNNKNITLFKDSQSAVIFNKQISDTDRNLIINMHAYSYADDDYAKAWSRIKPSSDGVNIALFHGAVNGAVTNDGFRLEADIDESFFNGHDIVMLGDIHKHQYVTADKRIAYPGSLIPQNFGETDQKGYLLWDICENGFDVNFIPLCSPHPFITVNWAGNIDDTIAILNEKQNKARFRIRSDEAISQADIKRLHRILKEEKHAIDIVYKIDKNIDANVISAGKLKLSKENLRDPASHIRLLKEFLEPSQIFGDVWDKTEKVVERIVNDVKISDTVRHGIKWSLDSMSFDNTFGYGRGNTINFKKLNGITGVFGPNKSGKSSLLGAIMYTLFNSTDRGAMKNLHIINAQKGHCRSRIDMTIEGCPHYIERQSVRNLNKQKNEIYAVTHVNFARLDNQGNVIADLNGVQRADTDHTIRKVIGTADDMLLTSLAAQCGPIKMDRFVNEGRVPRGAILARYLGLDIFEKMYEALKEIADPIKHKLASVKECDWNAYIANASKQRNEQQSEIDKISSDMHAMTLELLNVEQKLKKFASKNIVTPEELKQLENDYNSNALNISNTVLRTDDESKRIIDTNNKADTIKKALDAINIATLRTDLDNSKRINASLTHAKLVAGDYDNMICRHEKSIKKLTNAPCAGMYPTCSFIKDSCKNRDNLENEKKELLVLQSTVNSLLIKAKEFNQKKIEQELANYSRLESDYSAYQLSLAQFTANKEKQKQIILTLQSKNESLQRDIEKAKKNVVDGSVSLLLTNLNQQRIVLRQSLRDFEAKKLTCARMKGRYESEIERALIDQHEYEQLQNDWRIYEHLYAAWTKKGIPAQIIASQLPMINIEIANILHGITDFSLELVSVAGTNTVDIYIDDGGSKRIFELASGMEKMIGSLVIRVALLNVSSLPRPDVLIIDEGFGTLDEIHIAPMGRLLHSLKKWFRNIILITHVDGMKDVVDNVIEIQRDEKGCSRLVDSCNIH